MTDHATIRPRLDGLLSAIEVHVAEDANGDPAYFVRRRDGAETSDSDLFSTEAEARSIANELAAHLFPAVDATEYRNEDGETTRDRNEADGWTDAGLEVDSRVSPGAEWTPFNYEAGYDYRNNRYFDEARG